jgi:hypothetical protein
MFYPLRVLCWAGACFQKAHILCNDCGCADGDKLSSSAGLVVLVTVNKSPESTSYKDAQEIALL